MANELEWLQQWRLRMEKSRPDDRALFGIETLTTSGWLVWADLRDFGWDASVDHAGVVRTEDDVSWISSQADGPVLNIHCGPLMLEQALGMLRGFILEMEGRADQ